MANFFVLLLFFIQAEFPPLPTPTPWESPTPAPTIDAFIDDAESIMATSQAEQYQFEADGDNVQFNGQSILATMSPDDSAMLFGYMKWTVSNEGAAVFGPFSPLLIPIGLLVSIGFISLLVYFWENVIVTAFKVAGFVINSILRIFGR